MPPFTLPPHLFNPTLYTRLLTLWFSDLPLPASALPVPASAPTPPQLKKWFGTNPPFDTQCTSTALPALQSLSPEKYPLPPFTTPEHDHQHYPQIAAPFLAQFTAAAKREEGGVLQNEEAALALMLLLDQMPRNIFRSSQSVIYTHYDRISRAVAHAIYASELDTCARYRASPPYRMWFYLPLMHSEALGEHDLMAGKLADMESGVVNDERGKEYVGNLVVYERKHRVILERFGRYPHRNRVVGREGTEEEEGWLREGGDTFGAG